MNVYEKLQDARVQLQKKSLKKSGKNKFSGFDYFELADFLPAVNAIFADLKLASVFKLTEQEAFLSIINAEKPDEVIEFSMPSAQLELKGCNALQALGGVNTYCRRYLYFNALEIVENDFFDAETGKAEVKTKAKKEAEAEIPELDIIAGIDAISDAKTLEKYFKTYDSAITGNKQGWYAAVNKRKKELLKEEQQ